MKKSRYQAHLPQKKKRPPAKAGSPPALVGAAYSLEQIQDLLADLQSYERETALGAIIQFVSDYEAVSEGAMKTPEITITEVVSAASTSIERNSAPLVQRLEIRGKQKELAFLSEASFISKNLREQAAAAQKRLDIRLKKQSKKPEGATAKSPSAHPQAAGQRAPADARLADAVEMLKEAASGSPPSEGTVRAALWQKPVAGKLVPYLLSKGMLPELRALSLLKGAPPKIMAEAAKALSHQAPGAPATESVKEVLPPKEQETAAPASAPRKGPPKIAAPLESPPVRPLRIEPAAVESLLKDLDSAVSSVATAAVVKALKNYEAIAEFLSTSPISSVTKFSEKLFSALERNAEPVLNVLKLGKERKVLEFLLLRPSIPTTIKKRVRDILNALG